MKLLTAALTITLSATAAWAGVHGSQYQQVGTCGPYPRADVKTAEGMCAGIVAGPKHGLRLPRTILPIRPGEFLVTEMGGWVGSTGRVLRLSVNAKGVATVETLLSGLRQPHGLALGPDGKAYLGEKGRISRFDPGSAAPSLETVAENLPTDGLHPLTNLMFGQDGALIVNIGAPTDRCESKTNPHKPQQPCPLTEGDRPRAALWRMTFDRAGGKVVKTEVLARGLRNSMALAVLPGIGALIQGENGVDLPGENEPGEELNVIVPGKHYGWPSCWGRNAPLPGSGLKKQDCAGFEPAAALLPAHSAPLGMIAYDGPMFPALKGKLVIALHGYRANGHRIVAIDAGAVTANSGQPEIKDVVSGWGRKRGVRPMGAPVGVATAPDGSIWFAEDKNQTVMVLLRSDGGLGIAPPLRTAETKTPPPPKGWKDFTQTVLKPKCSACHMEPRDTDAGAVWAKLSELGWVGEGPLKDSKLARAVTGVGPEKPMPPPDGLKADPAAKAAFDRLLGMNP